MRNTKRSSCAECMGHECTGMLSAWYSELKTCIVELNFPLSQWPIQTPNNVHYVQSACLCPVLGFLTFFMYNTPISYLQTGQAKLDIAVWVLDHQLSASILLLKKDLRAQTMMTRCSRRISADKNTVLGWLIANIFFSLKDGVGGER